MRRFVTCYLCVFVLALAPTYSIAQTVFTVDYHVVLTIDHSQYVARNMVRVKDGHIIPVEFERHRVDLQVASFKEDMYSILITILERSNDTWVQMDDADPGGFGGRIGSFHGFDWNGDDMQLSMAIELHTVGSSRHQKRAPKTASLALPNSNTSVSPAKIPMAECEIDDFGLGGSADQMRHVFGEPEPISIAKSPYAEYPHREYRYDGLKIIFSTHGLSALSYAVTSPNYRLRSGVGVGSTRFEIEKAFGHGTSGRSGDTDYLIYLVLGPDGQPIPAQLTFILADDVVTHFSVSTR